MSDCCVIQEDQRLPEQLFFIMDMFISTSSNRKMSKLDYKTLEQGQNNWKNFQKISFYKHSMQKHATIQSTMH